MHDLELHVDRQYTSPFALSAFVALRVKQLPFELHALDLDAGQQHEPAFRDTALTARVPMLTHGSFTLTESSAIAEYLEQWRPQPPLYPADLQQRARARQVQAWLRSDLMDLRRERTTDVIFIQPVTAPLSPQARRATDKLVRIGLQLLGDGRPYLFGAWSIADIDLACMLQRLVSNGDETPAVLKDYTLGVWVHPAVQEWMAFDRTL
ncbi:MAG TPA: glutathione transferase [Burkholderiaceae bacterium]